MEVTLRGRSLKIPVLQGGMGIGVSFGRLAGAVAACGAMGTVSAAIPGFAEPDFYADPQGANRRALKREVRLAKEISGGRGMVAVNAMVATTQYADCVRAAIEAGVDAIVSGAGLPMDLPAIAAGADVGLAPIVSSGRAAAAICRLWQKHHGITPDFVVVEGVQAGGHLGFTKEEAVSGTARPLRLIVAEVAAALRPFVEANGRPIPVFAAGGVWNGADAAALAACGADGMQLATRFIATYECDASEGYKKILLSAKKEDVRIVPSPVGMPGRALRTPLIEKLEQGMRFPPKRCTDCLVTCPRGGNTPYCILHALGEAVKGNYEEGLFFCGSNVWRLNGMHSVKEVLDTLLEEWRAAE
ncbi:MAG: nitronate monooxygenase [Candidatus Pelethousia sp.]|nr:nitronate monooxygenase [Candidatus Pelethousia sp.]